MRSVELGNALHSHVTHNAITYVAKLSDLPMLSVPGAVPKPVCCQEIEHHVIQHWPEFVGYAV